MSARTMKPRKQTPDPHLFEKLLTIGSQMSNLCFNLSQREYIPAREAELMRDLFREWDEALKSMKDGK